MNDFYNVIYDHALSTQTLDSRNNPGYRRANERLDRLIAALSLDEKVQDQLMDAVSDLLYHSDVEALAFGFRLAVQVIAPVYPSYLKRV